MNTEQLKTAKEFLREASGSIRADEYHLINVMNSFASQESNKAVSEFKDKLKVDIKYMRNRTFKQDGMPVGENEDFVRACDDILDLIKKM